MTDPNAVLAGMSPELKQAMAGGKGNLDPIAAQALQMLQAMQAASSVQAANAAQAAAAASDGSGNWWDQNAAGWSGQNWNNWDGSWGGDSSWNGELDPNAQSFQPGESWSAGNGQESWNSWSGGGGSWKEGKDGGRATKSTDGAFTFGEPPSKGAGRSKEAAYADAVSAWGGTAKTGGSASDEISLSKATQQGWGAGDDDDDEEEITLSLGAPKPAPNPAAKETFDDDAVELGKAAVSNVETPEKPAPAPAAGSAPPPAPEEDDEDAVEL